MRDILPVRLPSRPRRLLELDLTRPLPEQRPSSPLAAVRVRHQPTLRGLVEAVTRAADDESAVGLVAHVGQTPPSFTQSSELRAAVQRFAASGKPTVAWAESFGEMGPGNVGYHLASGFEEVWLQPTGDLGLIGISATAVFLHDALEKLGVQAQLSQRKDYKSAANTFLESFMTEPHREMMQRLVDSATETLVADVAADRGLDAAQVRAALEAAPLSATDALARGLVDRLGYRDEVYAALRARLGEVETRYAHRDASPVGQLAERGGAVVRRHRPVVAVVHASGGIHLGRAGGPSTSPSVGSEALNATLRQAGEDDDVRAVVLRVDSPGGSYVASDAIRRQVHAVRGGGTPVVASMASVAASGGYYIAMPADVVLANPGTLTGSIGVLAGKQVLTQGLERLGVRRESVSAGRYAEMFSTQRAFDDEEWQRLERWLDDVYDDFTAKAAEDRGLPVERAGVAGEDVQVRTMPRSHPLEQLRPPENSDSPRAELRSTGSLAGGVLAELLEVSGLRLPGVLSLPWSWRLE